MRIDPDHHCRHHIYLLVNAAQGKSVAGMPNSRKWCSTF